MSKTEPPDKGSLNENRKNEGKYLMNYPIDLPKITPSHISNLLKKNINTDHIFGPIGRQSNKFTILNEKVSTNSINYFNYCSDSSFIKNKLCKYKELVEKSKINPDAFYLPSITKYGLIMTMPTREERNGSSSWCKAKLKSPRKLNKKVSFKPEVMIEYYNPLEPFYKISQKTENSPNVADTQNDMPSFSV